MPIISFQTSVPGLEGKNPTIIYINTNDTVAQVTTAGYLNGLKRENVPLSTYNIACVVTKTSPNASTASVGFYGITYDSTLQNWTLSGSTTDLTLPNGDIFVGNASNVATGVAMTGNVTISNTGVTAIAASAIVNSMVSASAAIDYSKLGTLTSGNILVGSAGNVATSVAMSGDASIIASGALTVGAGAITSAKLSPLTVQYARLTPTLATFLAMYDTPITLVAAQGANTMIIMEQVQVQQTYGASALASGGVSAIQYDVTAHGAGIIASTTLTAASYFQTASTTYTYNPGVVLLPFATTVNKALALSCLTGDFTTGTGSTFIIHVWYRVVATV